MRLIKRTIKIIQVFLFVIINLVLLDMFLLGAKLKDYFASANTSSYSPFNSDGQMNYILIGVFALVIIFLYMLYRTAPEEPVEEEDDEKKST